MSHSSGIVLHENSVTWLWIALPIFFLGGCMLGGMAVAFPLMMQPSDATSFASETRLLKIAAIGLPILSVLLVLFAPKITLYLDPMRNVVGIKRKALVWRSNKEFPFADIADVRVVRHSSGPRGGRQHTLALILKSGERQLLPGRGVSSPQKKDRIAAEIRAQLTPYLQ